MLSSRTIESLEVLLVDGEHTSVIFRARWIDTIAGTVDRRGRDIEKIALKTYLGVLRTKKNIFGHSKKVGTVRKHGFHMVTKLI